MDNCLFQALCGDLIVGVPELASRPDAGSQAALDAAWVWACDELTNMGCGGDTKTSRWFSWEQMSRAASSQRWLNVLALLYLGTRRRWWKSLQDNPLFIKSNAAQDGGLDPLPGEAASADGEAQLPTTADGAAGHAPAEPPDGPSAQRIGIAAGRTEVRKRRQQCCSTMAFVTQLLCRDTSCRLWAGMAHLPLPLERFHGSAVSRVKTQLGAQSLVHDLCDGALNQVVHDILAFATSPEFANIIGLQA